MKQLGFLKKKTKKVKKKVLPMNEVLADENSMFAR
jgi:hypothetical protein